MSDIDTTAAAAAGGAAADMHHRQQAAWGFVPNDAQVSCHRPEAQRGLGFGDAELFDVPTAAAGRAFFTKLLDALGVLADASLRSLEEPLRRALTVGRPIAERP